MKKTAILLTSLCLAAFFVFSASAAELVPATGGIGTTIFYVIGGVLAVGAAVLLFVKRRMS